MTDNIVGLDGGKKNPETEIEVYWQYGDQKKPRMTFYKGQELGFHFSGMEQFVIITRGDIESEDGAQIIGMFPAHVLFHIRDVTPSDVDIKDRNL